MGSVHGVAELIIGKQRHGPHRHRPPPLRGHLTRFSNLASEDSLPVSFEP